MIEQVKTKCPKQNNVIIHYYIHVLIVMVNTDYAVYEALICVYYLQPL